MVDEEAKAIVATNMRHHMRQEGVLPVPQVLSPPVHAASIPNTN